MRASNCLWASGSSSGGKCWTMFPPLSAKNFSDSLSWRFVPCSLTIRMLRFDASCRRRQPGDFVLLPDFKPPRQGELQRFAVEVVAVPQPPERVLVNLVAGHHPQDQPGPAAVLEDRLVYLAENLRGQERLAAARRHLDAEAGQVVAKSVAAAVAVFPPDSAGVPGGQRAELSIARLVLGVYALRNALTSPTTSF